MKVIKIFYLCKFLLDDYYSYAVVYNMCPCVGVGWPIFILGMTMTIGHQISQSIWVDKLTFVIDYAKSVDKRQTTKHYTGN